MRLNAALRMKKGVKSVVMIRGQPLVAVLGMETATAPIRRAWRW